MQLQFDSCYLNKISSARMDFEDQDDYLAVSEEKQTTRAAFLGNNLYLEHIVYARAHVDKIRDGHWLLSTTIKKLNDAHVDPQNLWNQALKEYEVSLLSESPLDLDEVVVLRFDNLFSHGIVK